jgi:hypothetical protein
MVGGSRRAAQLTQSLGTELIGTKPSSNWLPGPVKMQRSRVGLWAKAKRDHIGHRWKSERSCRNLGSDRRPFQLTHSLASLNLC